MFFVIRDDDTSFFTKTEELESSYGRIWCDIPVSLAVIPFDVPSYFRGIPEKFYQESYQKSIEENHKLINYLKTALNNKKVDIIMHGYNHSYKVIEQVPYDPKYWIPEFVYTDNVDEKLAKGKVLLERIFRVPITSFVPPSNSISLVGLRALANAGLNLVGLSPLKQLLKADILNFWLYFQNRKHPTFPYNIRQYRKHKQVLCHPLTPTCEWQTLCDDLKACSEKNGVFVVATHYWEIGRQHFSERATLQELLHDLIARARQLGAIFLPMRYIWHL